MASLLSAYSGISALMVPDLPGCSETTMQFYLHRAGRQFCEDSEAWTREFTTDLVADTATYDISAADRLVHRILRVRFLDQDNGDVAKDYNDGREIHVDRYELTRDPDTIQFDTEGTPSSDEDGYLLVVEVADVPYPNVDILSDFFITRWSSAIRYRATADLMMQPKRPYSDPQRAANFEGKYQEAVGRARFERTHESKFQSRRMYAPSFT